MAERLAASQDPGEQAILLDQLDEMLPPRQVVLKIAAAHGIRPAMEGILSAVDGLLRLVESGDSVDAAVARGLIEGGWPAIGMFVGEKR